MGKYRFVRLFLVCGQGRGWKEMRDAPCVHYLSKETCICDHRFVHSTMEFLLKSKRNGGRSKLGGAKYRNRSSVVRNLRATSRVRYCGLSVLLCSLHIFCFRSSCKRCG